MLYKPRFNALLESYIKKSFHFNFEYFTFFFFAFRHYLHNRRNAKIIFSIINAKKIRWQHWKKINQVRPCLTNFSTRFSRKRGVENSKKYSFYILDSPFMRDRRATLIPFSVHVIRPLILSQRQSFFCFAKFTRIYSRQLAV